MIFLKNRRENDFYYRGLPTPEELEHGLENLERNHYQVDYIISHCCPRRVESHFLNKGYLTDILTEYFDEISEKVSFEKWFFGHYHEDREILEKYSLLYKQIIKAA